MLMLKTVTRDYFSEESYSGESDPEVEPSSSKTKSRNVKSQPRKSSLTVKQESESRASSVATEVEEDKKPDIRSGGGSSFNSSNGVSAAGGKAKPAAVKAGRGQSTLAGFFKKK